MAKKKKATYTKSKEKQVTTKKSSVLQEQKPASKGEILFFRIGMLIVSLVVVGVIAIFAINYFTNDDDEDTNPYEDYITISQTSLDIIVVDNGNNTFGTRDDFQGYEEYEDLLRLLNSNEIIYFYFYHSSDINEDIEEALAAQTDVNGIPTYTLLDENEDEDYLAFFFIDLDSSLNAELFTDDVISHLELDEDADQMLVTFDSENEDAEFFTMESDVDEIIEIIEGLN